MHNFKFRVKTLCKINYLNLVHQINPTSLWKEYYRLIIDIRDQYICTKSKMHAVSEKTDHLE